VTETKNSTFWRVLTQGKTDTWGLHNRASEGQVLRGQQYSTSGQCFPFKIAQRLPSVMELEGALLSLQECSSGTSIPGHMITMWSF
jgi:hypothetical protein